MERDHLGWKVTPGSDLDRAVRLFIQKHWDSEDRNRFPGPQPISIERRHFGCLRSKPYYVCEKNDGVRNMLVCFEHQGKKMCLFVNRAFEARLTTLTVPRETILDGEMMEGLFLVYDAVLIRGQNMMSANLTDRLAKASELVKTIIGPIKVRVKKMYPFDQVDRVLKEMSPESDGLIFTPVNEPVRMGTHETLFKWKPRKHITIDFLVMVDDHVDGSPMASLWIQGPKYICPLGRSRAQGKDPCSFDGRIVECAYGECGWYIVRERPDKSHPNNKRTYERTLVNLHEDIQAEEFVSIK